VKHNIYILLHACSTTVRFLHSWAGTSRFLPGSPGVFNGPDTWTHVRVTHMQGVCACVHTLNNTYTPTSCKNRGDNFLVQTNFSCWKRASTIDRYLQTIRGYHMCRNFCGLFETTFSSCYNGRLFYVSCAHLLFDTLPSLVLEPFREPLLEVVALLFHFHVRIILTSFVGMFI